MRWHLGKPGMFFFGFHQLVGLLFVVDPRTTAAVFTALLQTGVIHCPTRVSGLLRQPLLVLGQLDPKTSTGQHHSPALLIFHMTSDHQARRPAHRRDGIQVRPRSATATDAFATPHSTSATN